MSEIWRDIPGCEGEYQASNIGRVRSLDLEWEAFNGKVMCKFRKAGQVLKPYLTGKRYKDGGGYETVQIKKKNRKVHRLVAVAFFDDFDESMEVNHKNGNTHDNRVENLEICTGIENMRHAARFGLIACGEKSSSAKLTEVQVREMRALYKKGCSLFGAKPLARLYGISNMTVRNILKGKKWRYCV